MSAMDIILSQAAKYSVGLAFRSGLSIAGTFAIRQVSNYIQKVPKDSQRSELELVSKRLDQKIKIVTPAIDLIEIIAARGNTTLDSTVQLTVTLRNDINAFGKRMNELMEGETDVEKTKRIVIDMKALLARIEDAVPLISLALTTSGANLSASLPSTVSPSRLLQASAALQAGDSRYNLLPSKEVQIGPSFSLKLYTIFEGHSRPDPKISNISWQETYAKCILEVIRMPIVTDVGHDGNLDINYLYHFRVTENLNDGRYHEELETQTLKKDSQGYIRGASRDLPVHNIARLFFSASGRLLNIEEARTPVLVLKINHALKGPSALVQAIFNEDYAGENGNESTGVHPDDLEWLALELWQDDGDDDEIDDDFETASESSSGPQEIEARPVTSDSEKDDLAMQMQILNMAKGSSISPRTGLIQSDIATLSLLEYILRLAALQTSEQQSLLGITDERISLYLRDEAGQSRTRSQEAEAVRRRSNERYETPSSIQYDDLLPGTKIRSRKQRSSTPHSRSVTPTVPSNLHTPQSDKILPIPGTTGSRRWPRIDPTTNQSPLTSKSNPQSTPNLFHNDNDHTTNGFTSKLRHSTE